MRDLSFVGYACVSAICAAGLSWVWARWAVRTGIVKAPLGGRHIHAHPTPEFGGMGIGIAMLVVGVVAYGFGAFAGEIRPVQLVGFGIGILLLLLGGYADDRYTLPPRIQIVFPLLAAIAVMLTGTGIVQVTHWSGTGAFGLGWWQWPFPWGGAFSLPADVLTFCWLLGVTYATKLMDGLDGLITGLGIIGAGMIAALTQSVTFYQPAVTTLAAIVGGSFVGFLPRNIWPARQFLGESGSTIVGFSLAFLSIVSGTKVATALMVLGVPIVDAAVVLLGRLWRRAPLTQGDRSHLHHRLLDAGLSKGQAVIVIWSLSLCAGLLALGLQTRGKLLVLVGLCLLTSALSFGAGWIARHRRP